MQNCIYCERLNDIFGEKMSKDFETFVDSIANGTNKKFSPPFDAYQKSTGDMLSFCNQFFTEYFTVLKNLPIKDIRKIGRVMHDIVLQYGPDHLSKRFNLLKDAGEIIAAVLETIQFHFAGRPFDGFECLEKKLTKNNFHLMHLLPTLLIDEKLPLYRVRKEKGLKDKKELFHIPFEKRHKCATERFSIPGYASLYLSESLETAILETKVTEPEYSASCFKANNKELKFVDLSLPNRELNVTDKYCLLVFYPLIVACGLKVKFPDAPFKPEYVVSQDLFLTIRLHYRGISGVSYTSTQYKTPNYKDDKERNYVLYVRNTESEKGYSEKLAEDVLLTSPYSPKSSETISDVEKKITKLQFEKFDVQNV